MDDLKKESEILGQRLQQAAKATDFEQSQAGKFAIEYLETRATDINQKIIGSKALSYEEYLDNHGRIVEINNFIRYLRTSQAVPEQVRQHKEHIDEQLRTIDQSES